MHIDFGINWDGCSWSEKPAALGEIRVGPTGLLNVLETRCGLAGPRPSTAERIALMLEYLTENDSNDAWYHRSLSNDPWGTAAEILAFRDELRTAQIAAGAAQGAIVSGGLVIADLSDRLASLIGIVTNASGVWNGTPDRIGEVLSHIHAYGVTGVWTIRVVEPQHLVPPIWTTVLDGLAGAGVNVRYRTETVDDWRSTGHGAAVTILHTSDEWQAADHVAAWLGASAGTETGAAPYHDANSDVTLVIGDDSGPLDAALVAQRLPPIHKTSASPARSELQVLPAVMANLWKPVDPKALAQLLSFPRGPVRSRAARVLLKALADQPGIGGNKWQDAMNSIADSYDQTYSHLLNRYLATERFDPDDGVPVSILTERLSWLARWLGARTADSPVAARALGQVRELGGIVERLPFNGDHGVPRILLERILGSVVRPVAASPSEPAAPWTVVSDVAAVPESAGTVIVWNAANADPPARSRFTDSEREVLFTLGYHLETPARQRLAADYYMDRLFARWNGQVILVAPDRIRGEECQPDAWIEWFDRAAAESNGRYRSVVLNEWRPEGSLDVAGRTIPLAPAGGEEDTTIATRYAVGENTIAPPEVLSYSRLSTLLGCPMKWALEEHVHLDRTVGAELSTGSRMLGNLAHAIVEGLVRSNHRLPDDVDQQAGQLFDVLVPQMAAELLLPGRDLDRRRIRRTIAESVVTLRDLIATAELTIVDAERFIEVNHSIHISDSFSIDVRLRGFVDMELIDPLGRSFVLDLKYSGGKWYQTGIEEGRALQLATYVVLIQKDKDTPNLGTGYYLIPLRRLVTDAPLKGIRPVAASRSLAEVWERAEHSTRGAVHRLVENGAVEVAGIIQNQPTTDGSDAAEVVREQVEGAGGLYVEPPCKFCDFGTICGLKRGAT